MNYRPEIDGLRAIAILLVLFFHANFTLLSGGFIGVDVFFVISGYLITRIILTEVQQGTFSLVRFYERRIRRILPALIFISGICIPFAWIWFLPDDYKSFTNSIKSVATLTSNFHFLGENGYFRKSSALKPLLHTWTLSLEEQYYIIFPLLMLLLKKFSIKTKWIFFLLLGSVSIVFSCITFPHSPLATFYLLPFRGWEFLLGSSCSIFLFKTRKPYQLEWIGLLGLGLIIVPSFIFNETTPFPTFNALYPTVGTALIIIFCDSNTFVGKFLSQKILVGLGIISYSAYLWHQPIFAFYNVLSYQNTKSETYLLLIVLTLVLSFFSWKYIEIPFRNKLSLPRGVSVIFAFLFLGLLYFAGYHSQNSMSGGRKIASSGDTFHDLQVRVGKNSGLDWECREFTHSKKCQRGTHPSVLLWGDSVAMHLAQALETSPTEISFVQMTKAGCAPVQGISIFIKAFGIEKGKKCIEFNENVLQWLETQDSIKTVVISSLFQSLLNYHPLVDLQGNILKKSRNYGLKQFIKTINRIKKMGKTPVIVSPIPQGPFNVGMCLVRHRIDGFSSTKCDFPKNEMKNKVTFKTLKKFKSLTKVVWLDRFICPNGHCDSEREGVFTYMDAIHFSKEGSTLFGKTYDLAGMILER